MARTAEVKRVSPFSHPDGIIAVPATPFTRDGRVDLESLRRCADHVLAHGAVGFLAPAVADEVESLSDGEHETIVGTLLEAARGRAPVIDGATASDPADRLRHARRFLAVGCTGVLASRCYDNDEGAYAAAVHALGELQPPLLMFQDVDAGTAPVPVPLIEATGGTLLHVGSAGPDMIELLDRGVRSFSSSLRSRSLPASGRTIAPGDERMP